MEGDFERIVVVATSSKIKMRIKRKITQEYLDTDAMPIVMVTGSEFVRMMKLRRT